MAAAKATYIVVWKHLSQVFSAATLKTAIQTPIPKGCTEEDKRLLFMSYLPDEEQLCIYPIGQEEIDKLTIELQEQKEND